MKVMIFMCQYLNMETEGQKTRKTGVQLSSFLSIPVCVGVCRCEWENKKKSLRKSVTGCCVATLDPFVSVHNVRVIYDRVNHSDTWDRWNYNIIDCILCWVNQCQERLLPVHSCYFLEEPQLIRHSLILGLMPQKSVNNVTKTCLGPTKWVMKAR